MVDLGLIARKIREDVAKLDKNQTNYEKIISMGIDELAEFLKEYFNCEYACPVDSETCYYGECKESILEWLRQEVG